jgi:O-antigen ligase
MNIRQRTHFIEARCLRGLRIMTRSAFLILCLRLQIAAIRSSGDDLIPVLALIVGGLCLGSFETFAGLFAFTVSIPILSGLSQTGFIHCTYLLSLIFASLWTAATIRRCVRRLREVTTKTGWDSSPAFLNYSLLYPELLAGAVLASFVAQVLSSMNAPGLWTSFLGQPVFGYADPLYFITSAFVWLQGLYYFTSLCPTGLREGHSISIFTSAGISLSAWVAAAFWTYTGALALFFVIQLVSRIPEGWAGAGFQSPLEDISSMGSVTAACFIFSIATLFQNRRSRSTIAILRCILLSFLLAASWSRGAWLASLVFLGVLVARRFPPKWTIGFLFITLAVVCCLNAAARSGMWRDRPYMSRLLTLVRFENPKNKASGRLDLYEKANRMATARPLVGHGIGSFYLKSINYGNSEDPIAKTPNFAHNVFLQLAAEIGLPVAASFLVFVSWVLCLGLRNGRRKIGAGIEDEEDAFISVALTLALATYMLTQMTANSLNVYVSNQFFFWFLVAGIVGADRSRRDMDIRKTNLGLSPTLPLLS